MTNNNTSLTTTTTAAAQRIDEIGKSAMAAFVAPESFEKELAVAQGIADLRAALTDELMGRVMALMNTSIGFQTDRNPATWSKPEPCVPYSVAVVKDVFIEARLRGFHVINNEFNIIAGRFYGCLNGFERLVKSHPKVTDFRDTFGIPVSHGDSGAVVKAKAEWMQRADDGSAVKQTCERDFAVRVNRGMGADAIIGKAKRKLYAAVYSRLSGVVTPEGEDDDGATIPAAVNTPAPAAALFGAPKAETQKLRNGEDDSNPELNPVPPGKTNGTTAMNTEPTPKQQLANTMSSSGVKFDDFRDYCKATFGAKDTDSWESYESVPAKVMEQLTPKAQAACIKRFGNVQAK